SAVIDLRRQVRDGSESDTVDQSAEAKRYLQDFRDAVFHDLGMPKALAVVHKLLGDSVIAPREKLSLLEEMDLVLGLGIREWKLDDEDVPKEVQMMLDERTAARAARNWAEADRIRDAIEAQGFVIEDGPSGTTVKPKIG
ncbi:MAG: hypothetical protein KDD44_08340, partial [Bdellovibrionales bacterium]|nr:hypothetical protein [Bdellovibrionales bacterium]